MKGAGLLARFEVSFFLTFNILRVTKTKDKVKVRVG